MPVPPLRHSNAPSPPTWTARRHGWDELVAAKERVLGLLAEKRRALITRAVTRGLDPRAPLRDSGIPWLGEIPAHWDYQAEDIAWYSGERDASAYGQPTLPLPKV